MSREAEPFFTPKEWKSLVLFRPNEWRQWWSTEPLVTKVALAMLAFLAGDASYAFFHGNQDLGWALIVFPGTCFLAFVLAPAIVVLIAGLRWCLRKTGVANAWRRVRAKVLAMARVIVWVGLAVCAVAALWPYLSLSPARTWYALTKGIPADRVEIEDKPHDCDFMSAPIGDKNCHYDATPEVLEEADTPDGKKSLVVSYQKVKE